MLFVKITAQEYSKMADRASPPSHCIRNIILAFLCGGAVCTLGQLLFFLYQQAGMSETHARAVVSITLIGLSAFLTALNVYDKFASVAGAGSLVPITALPTRLSLPPLNSRQKVTFLALAQKFLLLQARLFYSAPAHR